MYFIVDLVHGAADLVQSAAGIIADFVFVNDTSAYLGADQCQRLNLLEKYIQTQGTKKPRSLKSDHRK